MHVLKIYKRLIHFLNFAEFVEAYTVNSEDIHNYINMSYSESRALMNSLINFSKDSGFDNTIDVINYQYEIR